MDFNVTAKQYGNSVQFLINALDVKLALVEAKREARRIFDYQNAGDDPTVSVKLAKEPKESAES